MWHSFKETIYDIVIFPFEKLKFEEERKKLLSECSGNVLEIGIGTGLSLPYYPNTVKKLTAIDVDPIHYEKARSKLNSSIELEIVTTSAENLPFPDNSFDQVICFLVFCTIPEPKKAIKEIQRVLKPEGELKMMEHIYTDPKHHHIIAKIQDIITPVWKKVAGGCHLNRDTINLVKNEGFILTSQQTFWKDALVILKASKPPIEQKENILLE